MSLNFTNYQDFFHTTVSNKKGKINLRNKINYLKSLYKNNLSNYLVLLLLSISYQSGNVVPTAHITCFSRKGNTEFITASFLFKTIRLHEVLIFMYSFYAFQADHFQL